VYLNATGDVANGGETVGIKVEFFDQSTGEVVAVGGQFTVKDIDNSSGQEQITYDKGTFDAVSTSSTPATNIVVVDNGDTVTVESSASGGATDQNLWATLTFSDQTDLDLTLSSRDVSTGYGFDSEEFATTPAVTNTELLEDGADVIDAGDGDDVVNAGSGNDTVSGGFGADTIDAGEGDDFVTGDAGQDSIFGGDGADVIDGGADADTIDGGDGNDTIEGGAGNDSLLGGAGDDSILGGDGDDTLVAGNNTGAGDYLSGGAGDDVLTDSYWNATLEGGDGADIINVGYGNATVDGGSGGTDQDTLSFATADDTATVIFTGDEAGTYTDDDGDAGTFTDIEALELTTGADSVDGSASSAAISIDAGEGNDTIVGGSGNDTFDGGAGNDSLTGGGGDDIFTVSDGNDTITDFNFGNTGALGDSDQTNNDFVDLSGHYDSLDELRADQADDGILNQSNALDDEGNATDYSDNTQFGANSLTMQGATGSSYTYDNTGIVCFTSSTMIQTPQGEVPIDSLKVGDLVCTLDNGPQPLAWIGKRHCGQEELRERENLRPILIPKGLLGVKRDLLVSRQHGMLIGQDHFARAIHLSETMPGVRIAHGKREVTYIHLMFDTHQIIFAEGAPSESFYPGPMAMQMMSADACRDLTRQFPKLVPSLDKIAVQRIYGDTARAFLKKKELPEVLLAA